jgi:hypothetical protein
MNRCTFRFVFACAIVGLAASALAQPTITAADVGAFFASGRTITYREDTLRASVNIGSPGLTFWDFSAFAQDRASSFLSVTPASTPFSGQFPGATFALKGTLTVQGITGDLYTYLTLATDLTNPGSMATASGGAITVNITNSPADVTYKLPSTYTPATTWNSVFSETQTITFLGFPQPPTVTTHNASYVVDAYGPMTLPGGSISQTLRIRKIDVRSSTDTVATYIFVSPNGALVTIVAADANPATSGTINVAAPGISWVLPIATDVPIAGGVPEQFSLEQNYPNPFNPSTAITYEVAKAGFVTLKVYNLLGQEIASLVNEQKVPGTYRLTWNAEGVPSGVYFCTMNSGSFTATRRMMLLK